MEVEIDGRCLITLQFADDRVIVACDREDMQYIVRKRMDEYQERVPDSTQDGNWEADNGQEFLPPRSERVTHRQKKNQQRSHRRGRIKNDRIKQQMGIEGTIVQGMEKRQLTWYGHVERMPTNRWPRKILHWQQT
ncbi:hypothetical protein HUJ05_001986, partial [Dendroctonus ponderosae]